MPILHINIDLKKIPQNKDVASVLHELATDMEDEDVSLDEYYSDALRDSKRKIVGNFEVKYSKFECEHIEFDDFSHDCSTCGMTPREFLDRHETECVSRGDITVDEDNGCSRCGMNIKLLEVLDAD